MKFAFLILPLLTFVSIASAGQSDDRLLNALAAAGVDGVVEGNTVFSRVENVYCYRHGLTDSCDLRKMSDGDLSVEAEDVSISGAIALELRSALVDLKSPRVQVFEGRNGVVARVFGIVCSQPWHSPSSKPVAAPQTKCEMN